MILINPYFGNTCSTNVVGTVTSIGSSTSVNPEIPANGDWNYSWTAWILTAAEVLGAKQITGIGVLLSSFAFPYSFLNQTIKMGHVTQSSWPTTTPRVDLGDLTVSDLKIVRSSFTWTPTANTPTVSNVNFDSNFCYNGTSNLLIVWENRDGAFNTTVGGFAHTTGVGQGAYARIDENFPVYPTNPGARLDTKPRTYIYH